MFVIHVKDKNWKWPQGPTIGQLINQMMGWSHTYTHTSPHRESELNFVKKDIYIFSLIVSLYIHAEKKRLARNAPKHIYFGKAGLWAAFIYFFFKFFHNNFELLSLSEKIFLKICDIFLPKIKQMSLNSHFAWKREISEMTPRRNKLTTSRRWNLL